MQQTIQVEARVLGQRGSRFEPRTLNMTGLPMPSSLGDLITAIVKAEVASFQQRVEERRFLRLLTEQQLRESAASGRIRTDEGQQADAPTTVDVDDAIASALLAFKDGLFMVVVDDVEITDLEEVVEISESTSVLFVRLVALAGG